MDTTMAFCDSVATCMKETAAICQPCVKEAGTTWQDVSIVFLICLTLLIITLYAIFKYFNWKKDERDASAVSDKIKRDNEVKDREWKLSVDKDAHDKKREEEQEAFNKKRKVDLQDKLQNYIESQLKEGKAIADNDKYIDELRKMIDAL